eukprot:268268-Rhodomonas_salina.7
MNVYTFFNSKNNASYTTETPGSSCAKVLINSSAAAQKIKTLLNNISPSSATEYIQFRTSFSDAGCEFICIMPLDTNFQSDLDAKLTYMEFKKGVSHSHIYRMVDTGLGIKLNHLQIITEDDDDICNKWHIRSAYNASLLMKQAEVIVQMEEEMKAMQMEYMNMKLFIMAQKTKGGVKRSTQ